MIIIRRGPVRVLVACEFSGRVRDAFRARGHDAWSCDLLPTEAAPEYHITGPVEEALDLGWDMMVAHPPCTYLANSGVRHLYLGGKKSGGIDRERWGKMLAAVDFFNLLLRAEIPKIAIENPVMHFHASRLLERPFTQTIQPWQFGHPETKRTCLWLKGLTPLAETNNVHHLLRTLDYRERARVHCEPPGPDRWKNRSRTYPGIALAMAEQWG